MLDVTNEVRKRFQADDLEWDVQLADRAAVDAAACSFTHTNAGQNLAAGYSSPVAAIEAWANEYKSFDFAQPDWDESTGHFTQLVWAESQSMGCASYDCPTDGSTAARGEYLICNYLLVGNVLGQFPANVHHEV